jgi:predicted dehydrogenase
MEPLGIGIVGTGNIAGGYARDIPTHPHIRLVAATDVDPARSAAFGEAHGCRIHASLDGLLADPAVDIVVNLTVHHAHVEVSKRALEAGRHVYSEKPMALTSSEARALITTAEDHGVRLGCAPATFLGEAQQTAAAWIRDGRLGAIRAVYADVSHGRIETWHPSPEPFFDVGVLVDVAVYPLTLVTTMVGRATSVRAWGWDLVADRVTVAGTPFRIGSPDLVIVAVDLDGGAVLRLTGSFYVGRPAKHRGGLEFHGDAASLALGNFQDFNAAVEVGPYGGDYAPVPFVREPFAGIAWGRGVADLAAAISEARPHRASAEQAAHVVDILAAAQASMADDGRRIEVTSTFPSPPLMPWATLPEAESVGG